MAPSIGNAAIVTALFKNAAGVERAYDTALARGYSRDDINLVLSEQTRRKYFNVDQVETDLAHKAAESTEKKQPAAAKVGGPAGGTAATIAPALAAVGSAALLPGLVLAGPIAIALAAGGAVAIAGGLVTALTNWGIPKGRIEQYESEIRQGGVLIGVQARDDADTAYLQNEWQAAGGVLVRA
ncbi:hypothetical protein GCM10011487_56030 [Steroidobacter agaridevorans]|uniref:DUF1269 domain-containing protein n=1 Tax=Steroidobacter agaridevorans TaxID=2695856 RepID=A0A829YL77_9GAMM|nr:hypothetical protein [Steroidobacter agaridevorans]GFE83603.1 hypothetical protein GCM10011487_56030 [Steroidobacter agaridevorans]GFE86515.1 hypothetical protein GCM10011488_14690 [Steroidobacter agaridevorans]